MTHYRIIVALLFSSAMSFSSNAKDLTNLDDFPKWFKDAVAKDIEVKKTSRLKIDHFKLDAEVKGDFQLIDQSDGTWVYNIDIGGGAPVECYIFTDFDGPANSLSSIIDYSLTGVEELNNKSLSGRFNYSIDSGVIGKSGYVALDTLYNLGEGEEKVAGILKGIAAETEQSLQLCIHNEMGYRKAFFDVFTSFVTAFSNIEGSKSFFKALYNVSINDIPMGVIEEKYTQDSEGDINIINKTALIIPVDSNNIMRTDSLGSSWSSPTGSIINGTEYSIENGVMKSQFSLVNKDDKWHVEGQLQGKELKKELDFDGWFLSGFGSYLVLENLRSSGDSSGTYNMWLPSADPTSALPVELSKIENDSTANFKIDMGALVMKFMADEDGIFRHGTIKQGPIEMKMKLLYSEGKPALP